MIKLRIIDRFTLKDYKKVTVLQKEDNTREDLFTKGDIIICNEYMSEYLMGQNKLNLKVAEIIEVISDVNEETKEEKVQKTAKKVTKKTDKK